MFHPTEGTYKVCQLSDSNRCLGSCFTLVALVTEHVINCGLYLRSLTLVYKVRPDVLVVFPAVFY